MAEMVVTGRAALALKRRFPEVELLVHGTPVVEYAKAVVDFDSNSDIQSVDLVDAARRVGRRAGANAFVETRADVHVHLVQGGLYPDEWDTPEHVGSYGHAFILAATAAWHPVAPFVMPLAERQRLEGEFVEAYVDGVHAAAVETYLRGKASLAGWIVAIRRYRGAKISARLEGRTVTGLLAVGSNEQELGPALDAAQSVADLGFSLAPGRFDDWRAGGVDWGAEKVVWVYRSGC